jgi:hypothetical protein
MTRIIPATDAEKAYHLLLHGGRARRTPQGGGGNAVEEDDKSQNFMGMILDWR